MRRKNGGVQLTQEKFLKLILEKHGLLDAKKLTNVQMDSMGGLDPPGPEQ